MPVLQDPRLEIIAQHLSDGATQTDAYAAAYPNTTRASSAASAARLLADVNKRLAVDSRVAEILREREAARVVALKVEAKKTGLSKAWVLEQLRANYERAMQAEPVMRDGEPTGEYRYEGSVANKALELIGKEFGMFIERRETGQPGDFANMTDDEIDRYIRDRRHLLASGNGDAGARDGGTRAPAKGTNGGSQPH